MASGFKILCKQKTNKPVFYNAKLLSSKLASNYYEREISKFHIQLDQYQYTLANQHHKQQFAQSLIGKS